MDKKLVMIVLTVLLSACNLMNSEIDGEKVNVDETTFIYTYKENNEPVTGTVVFYELDPKTTKKIKRSVREVKDGKQINKGYDYYPSGSIQFECSYDANGLISGTAKLYYENGQLDVTWEYKDNKHHGIAKKFDIDGIQISEAVFDDDKVIKEYDFENGEKIIPAIEKLELVEYKTGFYEYRNLNDYQLLYQPIVIMKWKNISDKPLTERIEIKGVFINNKKSEEWSNDSGYFQGLSDTPLQVGLSRQYSLKSSTGYTSYDGIDGSDISCQIFINDRLYMTVKIENTYLSSDRIQ